MKQGQKIQASSIARALNIIGDRWTSLIVIGAFLGCRRFQDWQKYFGISKSILSNRLNRLVESECFYKAPYKEKAKHLEYRLSEKGIGLYPWIIAAWRWEQKWASKENMAVGSLRHRVCSEEMIPLLACSYCRQEVAPEEALIKDGAGTGSDYQSTLGTYRRSTITKVSISGTEQWVGQFSGVMGDRWTCLIIANAFDSGTRRYEDFHQELKVATNILSDRLKLLVKNGILEQRLYQQRPARYEYLLTEKGKDTYPIFLAMRMWGDRWLSGAKGPPHLLYHTPCGHRLQANPICSACQGTLDPRDVEYDSTNFQAVAELEAQPRN